jgi:hypothetical protein
MVHVDLPPHAAGTQALDRASFYQNRQIVNRDARQLGRFRMWRHQLATSSAGARALPLLLQFLRLCYASRETGQIGIPDKDSL